MILKLKYFGMIAEAVGKSEEEFSLTGNNINQLNVALTEKYSKLSGLNYKFAINQNMAEGKIILKENDEIALLPPFAGG